MVKSFRRIGGALVLLAATSTAWSASGDDGIQLTLAKGPNPGEVSLQWNGGLTPYSVFRSDTPTDVTTPISFLATPPGTSWVDAPPPGLSFYYVEGECDYDPPEICDGIDNDCDDATVDGSQDTGVGAPCDGPDTDLCGEGTGACVAAAIACDDSTNSTEEACLGNGGDEDCDGEVDEGFVLDGNPLCTNYVHLGALQGDGGSGSLFYTSYGERWLRVILNERNENSKPLTITAVLYSPPGSDYDLYMRCLGCAGYTGGWSFNHSLNGHADSTFLRKDDDPRHDDSFGVFIEVRSYATNYCGFWQLMVNADTGGAYETCGVINPQ